jgi:hypothetical protein
MRLAIALGIGVFGELLLIIFVILAMILKGILLIPFGIGFFLWGRYGRS